MTSAQTGMPAVSDASCSGCPAGDRSFCRALHGQQFDDLEKARRSCVLHSGENLFWEGERFDSFCTVLDGWLFSYRLFGDGRRQILNLLFPGDVVGSWIGEAVAHCSVQALTPSKLCVLPQLSQMDLATRFPELAIRYGETIHNQLVRSECRVASLGRQSARQRIAHFILDLCCRLNVSHGKPLQAAIPMPLTQEDIADFLGLTNVTVCRILGDFRTENLIRIAGHELQVRDPEQLAEICEYDWLECSSASAEAWI
tara:strand:- start:120 stop:887 length:768 start_codon:yes stop_codon:yes gene_type:complete